MHIGLEADTMRHQQCDLEGAGAASSKPTKGQQCRYLMFDVMEQREPREDAKRQVVRSKGHVRKVISQWQAEVCGWTGEAVGKKL